MNAKPPSRHGSSLGVENLGSTLLSNSRRTRKRELEGLGPGGKGEKRICRRTSTGERKLLKLHGINSEVRVNLCKLNPLDLKIVCSDRLSHCKSSANNNSNSKPKNNCTNSLEIDNVTNNFTGFEDVSKNVKVTIDEPKIKNLSNSSHNNSQHLIKARDLDKDDKNAVSSTKQSIKPLSPGSVDGKEQNLKNFRINSSEVKNLRSFKQETVKKVTPKSLFILNVDEINEKHLSNENKETIKVNNSICKEKNFPSIIDGVNENKETIKVNNSISKEKNSLNVIGRVNENKEIIKVNNSISKEKNSPSVIGGIDFLNFKPPPIREFTLKDFGLDKDPIISRDSQNVVKKFQNYNFPKDISKPSTSTKDQVDQETKIKKYSMKELGLSNAKVRTFGLKDFEKPSAQVFGIKDFEPKLACQLKEVEHLNEERKNLRSFRLDSLKDVRIKSKFIDVLDNKSINKSNVGVSTSVKKVSTDIEDSGSKKENVPEDITSQSDLESKTSTSTQKVESIVDTAVNIRENTSKNKEDSSDCQKSIETGKDSSSCHESITESDHKIVRLTDCSTSTSTKEVDPAIANKNSSDNFNNELKPNADDIQSKTGTHELSNTFAVGDNTNNLENEIELRGNSSQRETNIVLDSSKSHDLLLHSPASLTNNKDVSSVNISNSKAMNSNLSKTTNDVVQIISEESNISLEPNLKIQESNCKSNDSPESNVLTSNLPEIVNNIPSKIITPHSSENEAHATVLNDNVKLPDDINSKCGGSNHSLTSVSENQQVSLITTEVDVVKSMSEDDCSDEYRNPNSEKNDQSITNNNDDDDDDHEFSNSIHSDNISEACNYDTIDDDEDDIVLEPKDASTLKDKSVLEKNKSESEKSKFELEKSTNSNVEIEKSSREKNMLNESSLLPCSDIKCSREISIANNSSDSNTVETRLIPLSRSSGIYDDCEIIVENYVKKTLNKEFELGKSTNSNIKENEKSSSEKDVLNDSSLSCNDIECSREISIENKSSDSNTIETRLIPLNRSPSANDDCEIIVENCVTKSVVNSQNILKSSEDKQTENVLKVKYSAKEKEDLNLVTKRLKSNHSIRKMFFPAKGNNSYFRFNDVEILSDKGHKSRGNDSFGKQERIEDCSFDFPKFSVLDTESLMHSYKNLVCGSCFKHVDVKFTNLLNTSGAEFEVECFSCKHIRRFKRSKSCVNEVDFNVTGFDNLYMKLVYSCLDFGGGYNQLQSTCLALNIPHLNKKSFDKYCSYIISQSEGKLNTVLKAASEIVHNVYENAGVSSSKEGIRDINVIMDSWIPKGKRKKYSLVVVIDLRTGLVLDYYLTVNYCQKCFIMRKKNNFESWKAIHQSLGQCHINCSSHEDNMESEASRILCSRSQQKYKFKYTFIPSDINVTQIAANQYLNPEIEKTTSERKLGTLNESEPVLCSYEKDCSRLTENKTSSLEQNEIMKDIILTDKKNSGFDTKNLSSSSLNAVTGKSNSTSEKVSSDSCDSNGAMEIQSTSSQLTLTNINSLNNGDSDKEFQELNKSLNHILEEVKMDLTFDLNNIVPSVTSSDTLSEGLLEGNGVDLLAEEEAKDISFGKVEPLSAGVLDLANQSSSEGTSVLDVTEKSTENGVLMLDTTLISHQNKRDSLSNVLLGTNNDEDEVTRICENSNKVDNIGFSFGSSQRQEEQGENNDEKLNNSLIYDEHREMASLLASNVLDQDVTTDFENSVSKENIDPNLRDTDDLLQEGTDINGKSFNTLLDEKSTVNEVSNLLVKEPVNESKAVVCNVPILDKDCQSTDSDIASNKNQLRQEMKITSPNKNTPFPLIEEKSQTAEKSPKSLEKNEKMTQSIVGVQMTRLEKLSSLNNEEASSKSENATLTTNVQLPKLDKGNNLHCEEESSKHIDVRKILKKAKKDALRSNILKNCNTSAPLAKDFIQFACYQAIILYNVNIENIIFDPSNKT